MTNLAEDFGSLDSIRREYSDDGWVNNDDSEFLEDEISDDDIESSESDSISLPLAPVEANVCRFFTTRPGCNRGNACRDKHFSEKGECFRCLQVVKPVDDVELHCLARCELRPSSATISDSQRFGTLGQSSGSSFGGPNALWKAKNVCCFHLKGCCAFGSSCNFLHLVDNKCVLCEDVVAAGTLDQHLQTCPENQILKSEMQKTEKFDCPICFCHLREIPALDFSQHSMTSTADSSYDYEDEGSNPQESILPFYMDRFGLLLDCCHLFCFQCVQRWKESQPPRAYESLLDFQKNRSRCPKCEKETRFTVPCNRVIEDPMRCQREKEIFSHFKQLRFCKNFKKGRCGLGSNCLYSHLGFIDAT